MTSQKHDPLRPSQQSGIPPRRCSKCTTDFNPLGWARSKWTRSGYSPWCPACFTSITANWDRFNSSTKPRPGPKPKRHDELED